MRELTIKGIEVTASFVDLLETLAELFSDLDEVLLPVIEVGSKETDYGLAPVFMVENLLQRPDHWKPPIVSFKCKGFAGETEPTTVPSPKPLDFTPSTPKAF